MKKLCNFIFIIVLSLNIVGCSCSENENLIVYRGFYDVDASSFNYLTSNEYQEMIHIANLVDGLVENDKYGNIVPSIAKSWKSEIIDNKQIWTFYLRDNVYWSDYKGNKYGLVTAYDFVTSLKYILNYTSESKNYKLPSYLIENGENYYNGTLINYYNYNQILTEIEKLTINDPYNLLSHYLSIKNTFDICSTSGTCTTDFNDVGVKALDNFTLQYTLSKPVPYFLSVLTNYSFLPSSQSFINKIGFNNFGTNKKNLLYNGGYILENYYHSSRIEYIKNSNYWDKSNIFIDKLIFTKILNTRSANYDRLAYETGNITEFSLNPLDKDGWKKYITGSNNQGSINSPIGKNTYVSTDPTSFVAYYFVYNQNRSSYKYTSLSKEEGMVSSIALKNVNFRKALNYGIDTSIYTTSNGATKLNSIIPQNFLSYNDKDYFEYFLEEYAINNSITIDEARSVLESTSFQNKQLSNYYLDLAIKELNLDSSQLPIKVEYTYYYNEQIAVKNKQMINEWNRVLNGCFDDEECEFNKIEIIFNDSVSSASDFVDAFYLKEYGITLIGLYPDYYDTTTYLNAFMSDGEMNEYIGHSINEIDDKIIDIDQFFLESQLDDRYKASSKLEYDLIHKYSLVLPVCLQGVQIQATVSDIIPFEKMKANYGLSPFKFKGRKITTHKYNQQEISELERKYKENMYGSGN